MDDDGAGLIEPGDLPQPEIDGPFLEEARQIEREMYLVMTTQVKLAIIQVALGIVSIALALIIGLILR